MERPDDDPSSSALSCSICLDSLSHPSPRSIANLHCGHQFHLDCIGSAFNMKGAMQCPNCRNVEKGRWLYANGSSRSTPEISMEDWIPDEDFYDLAYSEMPYRFHWCPYGELARVGSSFEDVESPSTTYHDLRGHHSAYAEHTAAPSVAHSYIALVGPIPPNSSRSNDSVDDPNFNQQWNNGVPGRQEMFSTHAFPAINIPLNNSWGRRSPPFAVSSGHINGGYPATVPLTYRSSNAETDARTRSMPFPHPVLFGHGTGPIAGSSFVSSIVPRHPGSGARIQISHGLHHHRQQASNSPGVPSPIIHGVRRSDGPRGLPALVPAPSQHDGGGGGFLIIPPNPSGQAPQEAENPLPNHFHAWERDFTQLQHVLFERDSNWGSFHQNGGGPDPSGNRTTNFWHRHAS
ncbi:RING/U-box superfamily protein [Euphorbia peplus]|nr:RING/U-box superfamily protein [Euphorbia peplus]